MSKFTKKFIYSFILGVWGVFFASYGFATPLTPQQCTQAMLACGSNIPCQNNLKKFNGCTTPADCKPAMESCKKNLDCLQSLKDNAGCGVF